MYIYNMAITILLIPGTDKDMFFDNKPVLLFNY